MGDYLYIDGGEIMTWNGRGDGNPGSSTAISKGDIILVPGMLDLEETIQDANRRREQNAIN